MIAAIYARKSTEQTGVANEDRSVTRQIEHGKAYALMKGWTVANEHVNADDGILGAEFLKRPGFVKIFLTRPSCTRSTRTSAFGGSSPRITRRPIAGTRGRSFSARGRKP